MKKILVAGIAGLGLFATQASAIVGVVDIELGAGVWNPTISGDVAYGASGAAMDLDKNLGLEADSNSYMYMRFDHFIPVIPNLRIEMQNYSASGTGTATGDFGGVTFGADTTTDITLNQTDYTLYWGIPGLNLLTAGILDVEVGLNVKQLEGEIALESLAGNETADFSVPLPMVYGAVLVDLPVIPVGLEVSLKQVSVGDSKVADTKAKVAVALPLPIPLVTLSLEAGVKQQTIEITDDLVDDLNVKIDNSGMFFGANVKF